MAHEIKAGQWVGDGVLSALGEDPTPATQEAFVVPSFPHHPNLNDPTIAGPASFTPIHTEIIASTEAMVVPFSPHHPNLNDPIIAGPASFTSIQTIQPLVPMGSGSPLLTQTMETPAPTGTGLSVQASKDPVPVSTTHSPTLTASGYSLSLPIIQKLIPTDTGSSVPTDRYPVHVDKDPMHVGKDLVHVGKDPAHADKDLVSMKGKQLPNLTASGSSWPIQTMQSASGRPAMTRDASRMSFRSNSGQTPNPTGFTIGPRATLHSYDDPASLYYRHGPFSHSKRVVAPELDLNAGISAEVYISSGPPVHPGGRSMPLDASRPEIRQTLSSLQALSVTQAIGSNRGNQIGSSPSVPKAMRALAASEAENTRPTTEAEPRKMLSSLRQVDLEKGPCRHCHFVHRGGECERSCIGCGSERHYSHDLICPFRDKRRLGNLEQISANTGQKPFKDVKCVSIDSRVSNAMELSLECQRRGFNPEFRYYRRIDVPDCFLADLYIRDVHISGEGICYKSQKDARDALALKGLEAVRQMSDQYGPGTFHPNGQPVTARPSLSTNRVESPGDILNARLASVGLQHPRSAHKIYTQQSLVKQSSQPLQEINNSLVVELPGNIDPRAARDIVERALSANSHRSISLHFPRNVSLEVAQAYGLVVRDMETSCRHRSRSPPRDRGLGYRDRDRGERERERDRAYGDPNGNAHYLRPPRFPRPSIDAYRPRTLSSHSDRRPRSQFGMRDYPRLLPAPETNYQSRYERAEKETQRR